jgi:HSP20 family protein
MPPRDKPTPQRLHSEIEELFSELWQVPRFAGLRRGFRPNVDSYHTDDPHRLTVVIELPGVDPASINIVVGERALVINGDRPRPKIGGVYQQMEIEYGPFRRLVRLPEDIDPVGAKAEFDRGMVTVTLPVAEQAPAAQTGRVTIEVERK